MKIRPSTFSTPALAALLAVSALSFAAETSDNKTSAKEVARKTEDAGKAIGSYTIAERGT